MRVECAWNVSKTQTLIGWIVPLSPVQLLALTLEPRGSVDSIWNLFLNWDILACSSWIAPALSFGQTLVGHQPPHSSFVARFGPPSFPPTHQFLSDSSHERAAAGDQEEFPC